MTAAMDVTSRAAAASSKLSQKEFSMLAALVSLLGLIVAVKLVIAACGYTITWRLAAVIVMTLITISSCLSR
jgi:hypothetical protein